MTNNGRNHSLGCVAVHRKSVTLQLSLVVKVDVHCALRMRCREGDTSMTRVSGGRHELFRQAGGQIWCILCVTEHCRWKDNLTF